MILLPPLLKTAFTERLLPKSHRAICIVGAGTLPRGVGLDPNGANARDVVVVPVVSEQALRNLAWVESSVCRLGFVQGRLSVAISVGENRDSYSPTLPPGFYEATDSRTT